MRRALINVSIIIGDILSYIFPPSLIVKIKLINNSVISGYFKRQFKSCGSNFSINYPFYHFGLEHIEVGNNFSSFAGLRLEAHGSHLGYKFTPKFTIGDNVSVNHDCHFGCINRIIIGNDVLIGSRVFITDHFHGSTDDQSLKLPPSKRKVFSKGAVIIENNVWIGEGVAIMPGITIGENSIIGANAVVTKSFPANSVIVGNPAKLIKKIK